MKRSIFFNGDSVPPNFPLLTGLVLFLLMDRFPIQPYWLFGAVWGIIWFLYVSYSIGVIIIRVQAIYVKPFDGKVILGDNNKPVPLPLDDKIGRALLQNEKI